MGRRDAAVGLFATIELMARNDWDEYSAVYLEKMGSNGDYCNRELILPALLALCGDDLAGKRVLDLACGHAQPTVALAQRGANVVGVDFSKLLLREAQRRVRQQNVSAGFALADAAALPFAPGTFDLIVSNMALDAIAYARAVLAEAARVARPGAPFVSSFRHPWTDGWAKNYLDNQVLRIPVQIEWRGKTSSRHYPPRYHRPLSHYVNALYDAGFTLVACNEVVSGEELLAGQRRK
ncbi:MAG TPA: class I SAM-dependent methyltransferase [Candidatus Hydrogenedentes bacterium]|nr:class I SAM-dependent methyltransferase [Candidatus Hydrogenedentota bacterium]